MAALLTVLLVPVLVVANLSIWSLRTVVEDAAFTRTISRSLDTPSVDALVADAVSTVVLRTIDQASVAERLVGIQALGLPIDADDAAVRQRVEARVLTALDDPRVRALRDDAIEGVHGILIGAARGDGALVRIEGRDLVLDVDPIVEVAADTIDPRLVGVVRDQLDPSTTRIVVASSDGIATVSTTIVILDTLRWVIPLLVVAATLLIVVVAHRRVRALGAVGVAVMVAGLISLGVVWVGGLAVPASLDDPAFGDIAAEIYGALTTALVLQSAALVLGGAAIVLATWAVRRRRRARAVARPAG